MGAIYVYRLAPRGAFHFGLRGVGIEATAAFCPADTLFSALCLTVREWEPDGRQALEAWLARFPPLNGGGPPPLRLSSAFPYAGPVLFFPKPLLPARLPASAGRIEAKRLKKVSLVSEQILRAWLAQRDLGSEIEEKQFIDNGTAWISRTELKALDGFRDPRTGQIRPWARQTVPRVTVDRATSQSAVYQAGVLRFRPGAGLFTLVEFLDGSGVKWLKDILTVLGDGGLGGERSSGYGQFELEEPAPFEGWNGAAGKLFLTLAPYHPTPAEVAAGVLGEGTSYDLLTRRGWVGSPEGPWLRRRQVRLLGEGSVLRHPGDDPQASYGDLADVTPRETDGREALGHKVWRYGIAFPVPAADVAGEEGVE